MNKEQFKGSWLQLKGKIKEKWGKLTDDDLAVVEGREDRLIGKLQERYGIAKAEAETTIAGVSRVLPVESRGGAACPRISQRLRTAETAPQTRAQVISPIGDARTGRAGRAGC